MKNHWNKEYYDILSFYCQEPEHLGKITDCNSKFKKTKDALIKVQNIEVSLNHLFNLFFNLIPNEVLNQIFASCFNNFNFDDFSYQYQSDIDALDLGDMTQPDAFFRGSNSLVGVEFKLNHKSNLKQILKYASLFYFAKNKYASIDNFNLLLIGKVQLPKFFKEKFPSIASMKSELSADVMSDYSKRKKIDLRPHKDAIVEIAREMNINYFTYKELNQKFNEIIKLLDVNHSYSQTIVRLFEGIQSELLDRGLS